MANEQSGNHGEGNPEAARNFNEAEQRFVNSPPGRRKIEEGAKVRPEEQAALEDAERRGREHAKEEDPAVQRESH